MYLFKRILHTVHFHVPSLLFVVIERLSCSIQIRGLNEELSDYQLLTMSLLHGVLGNVYVKIHLSLLGNGSVETLPQ
jgi:hypothetical protein